MGKSLAYKILEKNLLRYMQVPKILNIELKGTVSSSISAKDVSLVISPGSSNILKMLSDNGSFSDLITAGARILEAKG